MLKREQTSDEMFENLPSHTPNIILTPDFTADDLKKAFRVSKSRTIASSRGETLQLGLFEPDKKIVPKRPVVTIRASQFRKIAKPSTDPSPRSNFLEDKKTEGIILHDLIELAVVKERLKNTPKPQFLDKLRWLYPTVSEEKLLELLDTVELPIPEQIGLLSAGGIDLAIREGEKNPYQPILSQVLATGRSEGPARRMTNLGQNALTKFNLHIDEVLDRIPFQKGDMIVETAVEVTPDKREAPKNSLKSLLPTHKALVDLWAKPDISILERKDGYNRVTVFDIKSGRAPQVADPATVAASEMTCALLFPEHFYKINDAPHLPDRPQPFTISDFDLLDLALKNYRVSPYQTSVEHITLYLGEERVVARRSQIMSPKLILDFLTGLNPAIVEIIEKARAAKKSQVMNMTPSRRLSAER